MQQIGDHHTRDMGRQHMRDRHAVARRLDHHFVHLQQLSPEPLQGRAGHLDQAFMPGQTVFPDHHLPEGTVDVDPDHASHRLLLSRCNDGSGGRHDTYGFALSAQSGESQRRSATNTSSKLIVCIDLPAHSCSRCLRLGCSQHTLWPRRPQPDVRIEILIPATNSIEALNSKIRRAVRTRGCFPSDDATAKLIYLALNANSTEWKRSVREWHAVKSQFAIMFEERFPMA